MKKQLHIISHSHWDREWYMSFESHRARLVELMDTLIEKMENDPEYKYFHLDGQTIVIEDYLEIRPEMKDRLDKLIKDGRIQVGPWYVLQDEFLISGEANVRNMLEGKRFCMENGYPWLKVGYFPDAFANISQVPQLLLGFGIDNAVFGRGVGEIMADNKVGHAEKIKELIWKGADGSKIMGVMFTNWYNNATELPVDMEKSAKTFNTLVPLFEKTASTPHWLGMNGCDHQPVQLDLPQAINTANLFLKDEVEVVHSNFNQYIEVLRPYKNNFVEVSGELTGRRTSGKHPISDTASTHQPLKIKNHKVQNLLEQQSEPISVMSTLCGDSYREHFLRYAFKKLMQNHPHDSICACSCDDVAIQMSARFDCARDVALYVRDEAAEYIAQNINTENLSDNNIVVFHTSPFKTKEAVSTTVWLDSFEEALYLTDLNGNVINSSIEYCGVQFTYKLPKDRFRIPLRLHKYNVRFQADIQGIGYTVYKLCSGKAPKEENDLKVFENGAENSFIKLRVCDDGTLEIYDKISGRLYSSMNMLEDCGDSGNSYDYKPTEDNKSLFPLSAGCSIAEKTPFSATFEIKNVMEIPCGLSSKTARSEQTLTHTLISRVTVYAKSRRVDISTTLNNQSENHRLRALFPSCIQTDTAMADGQFDVIRREIKPWEGWINPCNNQRMQAFVGIEDDTSGVLIASRGLHSYEVLRDGKNTVALTLLRAVGEMGDWGDFPTPKMQVKGDITLNYSVIPYAIGEKSQAFNEAYTFSGDRVFATQTGKHGGKLENNKTFVTVKGDFITCTAFKAAEDKNGMILRLCNISEQEQQTEISFNKEVFSDIFETNLAEETADWFDSSPIPSKKIKTYRLK